MNLHFSADSFWLRIGKLGLSITPASAECIDAFTLAKRNLLGLAFRLCRMP